MEMAQRHATVFFDGVCNFCHRSILFIIQRDRNGYFKFASLQSNVAREILEKASLPHSIDSLILIERGKIYTESSAVLRIARRLDGLWKVAVIFLAVPKSIRDRLYRCFARNRYRWFGKRSACVIPTDEMRRRFLSLDEKGESTI